MQNNFDGENTTQHNIMQHIIFHKSTAAFKTSQLKHLPTLLHINKEFPSEMSLTRLIVNPSIIALLLLTF